MQEENILDQHNFSANREFKLKTEDSSSRKRGNSSITKSNEGPMDYGIKLDTEDETKVERKPRGSADWLGLKDSPVKLPSFGTDDYMHLKTSSPKLKPSSVSAVTQLTSQARPATARTPVRNLLSNTEKTDIRKDSEDIPLPSDSPLTMSLRHKAGTGNRNKGKLIDELFGEAKLAGEDSFRIGVDSEPIKPAEENQGDGYMPSATFGQKLERRGASAKKSSSRLDSDFDWLLGTKSTSLITKEQSSAPATASVTAPVGPAVGETKISTPSAVRKEKKIPDWLEGIIPDTPRKEEVQPKVSSDNPVVTQASKLPEWLNGTAQVESTESVAPQEVIISNQEVLSNLPIYPNASSLQLSDDSTKNLAVRLASIQKELGDAIARRNQNLQHYMQVLIQEAQKVAVSFPEVITGKKPSTENSKEESSDSEEKVDTKNEGHKVDKACEISKHQDDLIHDFEININRLELQNVQLEMKLENLKSIHEMEIEMIKKNHGYEISSWESRLERMETSFKETIEDYKRKIDKLKENEENLIAEYKERLRKMEEERVADLEKLGEFHRIAIEQAATLTIPLPNINQSLLRLPLKALNRPKDEVEMSERETALLEKERQIEVLKAAVEVEKRELDEALEIEKIRREERERDLRRQATEVRLREEARLAEAKREREQLDALSLQIKLMREEALKEQGELAKEKMELAAERARLEATYSIQGRSESSIPPFDIMQARAEVEAALETARQAKEAAEQERRRQAELRHAVDQITWEQKEMDLRLENREKHLSSMLRNAETLRHEGLTALEEAKAMKEELDLQQKDIKEQIKQIETKEKILAKERLEIAKEKIELERRRAQLDIILPQLNPAEELTLHPPKTFVDPKAVIMRLKAEKELESFITNQKH